MNSTQVQINTTEEKKRKQRKINNNTCTHSTKLKKTDPCIYIPPNPFCLWSII